MAESKPSRRKVPRREKPPVEDAGTPTVTRKRRTRPAGPVVPAWRAAGVEPIGPDPVEEETD